MTELQQSIRRTSARRAISALLLLAGLAALPALPGTGAAQAAEAMRGCQRISDYVLVVGGKEAPAEIYQCSQPALLVISSALASPVLLSPATSSASTVNLMKIDKRPDGTLDLLPGAPLAAQGSLEFVEEEVHFRIDGRGAELKPAPPLLGLRRVDEVTAHNPEYVPRAAAYAPNAQLVAGLRKEARPVVVRIFFGSWCPHCREMVPHAIKLEQQLKGSQIHFEYFGLPPHFGTDANAQKNAISGVPTGIVYVNGREVGRIVGDSWRSPETLLTTILGAVRG
jgi:thiol-disulfide isomerase/thioredoxin